MDILHLYIPVLSWPWEAVLRLIVASLLGAIIGMEREHHGREAGFRTQLLVSLGAALAMVVSLNFAEAYGGLKNDATAIKIDPGRIAYGVMVGIGFLGAGAIVRYGAAVRGLTTAASIWCTAAVGLASGFGMFLVAALAAILVLIALVVLRKVELKLSRPSQKTIEVLLRTGTPDAIQRVRRSMLDRGIHVFDTGYSRSEAGEMITLQVLVPMSHRPEEMSQWFREIPEILGVTIR